MDNTIQPQTVQPQAIQTQNVQTNPGQTNPGQSAAQVPNYSGVNIQIFNPSVATPGATLPAANYNTTNYATSPVYPQNYYTQNFAQPATSTPVAPQTEKKEEPENKTETRDVVELTDDYVKTLENYLNNQDQKVRLMGAKEVLKRAEEDESRKDDPALIAIVNKMLQDPYQPVKLIAMSILEERNVSGDQLTVNLLQNMQKQKVGSSTNDSIKKEDSLKASKILLKMSGNTVKKDFDVTNDNSKEK